MLQETQYINSPKVENTLETVLRPVLQEIRELRRELETKGDCWLDARGAAAYMNISISSFDKYRYKTSPKLKGYNLDGKTLYRKSDIDSFIRLYEIKSRLALAA